MWWHPGIVLAIVPVWKEGRRDRGTGRSERDRDRWRDGIAVLMWHWGPSKVENLDIIDSYTGRSGNPIRTQRNVPEFSVMTSENFREGPAGSGTHISSSLQIPNIHVSNYSFSASLFIFHYNVLISTVCVRVCACKASFMCAYECTSQGLTKHLAEMSIFIR